VPWLRLVLRGDLDRGAVDRAGQTGAVFRRLHGDRDLDRTVQPAAQRLGDRRAQAGLDHVARERVRDGEQSCVLHDGA